jgi:hypothetical protein
MTLQQKRLCFTYAATSWTITSAGDLITLEGLLCTEAETGRFESVSFEFGCVDAPSGRLKRACARLSSDS